MLLRNFNCTINVPTLPVISNSKNFTSRTFIKLNFFNICPIHKVSTNNTIDVGSLKKIVVMSCPKYQNKSIVMLLLHFITRDFPQQSNLICLGPKVSLANYTDWYCLLRFGDSYGLPYFQHYGTSRDEPIPCVCGVNGQDSKCNDFDFLVGAMLYDHTKNISYDWGYTYQEDQYSDLEKPFLPFLEYLFGGPLNPPRTIKEKDFDVFHAAWISSTHAESGATNNSHNQTFRDDAYRFSNTSFGTATFFSFHAYSNYGRHSINSHSFQVTNGSCADSFDSVGFDSLVDKPWAPLNEIYYQCTYKMTDAMTI